MCVCVYVCVCVCVCVYVRDWIYENGQNHTRTEIHFIA